MEERFFIAEGSVSGHCCFLYTVCDRTKLAPDGLGLGSVCECFDREAAILICSALNEQAGTAKTEPMQQQQEPDANHIQITAAEAREIATKIRSHEVNRLLESIYGRIRVAAANNKMSCSAGLSLNPWDPVHRVVSEILEAEETGGFKLTSRDGDVRSGECDWTEISWAE